MNRAAIITAVVLLVSVTIGSYIFIRTISAVVPPGTIVIVLKPDGESRIHTDGSYWAFGRDRVYFIDTKLKGFTEKMEILCADNINMAVDVKWVGSFSVEPDKIKIIKEKVPARNVRKGDLKGYQLSLQDFYVTAMKDIIRANSREVISPYVTDNIREARSEIQQLVKSRVMGRLIELNYPVETTDILISNLDYPPEVTAQRKAIKNAQLEDQKQAALAKAAIEQAKREASIAREKGKAKIEIARADAEANRIRASTLTEEIIRMRQWDVFEAGALSQTSVILLPYKAIGTDSELTDALLIRNSLENKK
ncbi:MAG: hypothetical protein D6B25_19675 [Desulfobulbaceae bacterium]|nr:MAG: hypothetical protein D6B25_19675 [Desulfobulbaceae bacterium]